MGRRPHERITTTSHSGPWMQYAGGGGSGTAQAEAAARRRRQRRGSCKTSGNAYCVAGRCGRGTEAAWLQPFGGVPEWSNGAVSKTVVPYGYRGFESLPLRQNLPRNQVPSIDQCSEQLGNLRSRRNTMWLVRWLRDARGIHEPALGWRGVAITNVGTRC